MFSSFSVGALCALLAAFLIAAIGKWVGFQPNRVVVAWGAESSHAMGTSVCAEPSPVGGSARSTISTRLKHEGGTPYGGVFKFFTDASDLMRLCAQRSSI